MKRIIIYILALCCILMGCGTPQTNKSAAETSLFSDVDSSIPSLDNSIAETSSADDWNPTDENFFRYLDGEGNTNGVLERWIEDYRRGEPSQIYLDDPYVFLTWRLTCDGPDKYLIENRYLFDENAPVKYCGYSQIVTEGTIYYAFGEDLTEIDWLPLTIHKGLTEETAISADDDLWIQQATISEEQAIALAAEVFDDKDNHITYQFEGRFVCLGQCYYGIKLMEIIGKDSRYDGFVAISADGSVFWEIGEGWNLIKDKSAVRVQAITK